MNRYYWLICAGLILSGCSTTQVAPVVDMSGAVRTAAAKKPVQPLSGKVRDWRPATHVVQKGDTLYSIALEYGLDYRELAGWNSLVDLNHIQIGQSLRLAAPDTGVKPEENSVQVMPLQLPAIETQAIPSQANAGLLTITQPQAIKLPYSASAVTQLSNIESSYAEQPAASKAAVDIVPAPAPAPAAVEAVTKPVATPDKPASVIPKAAPTKEADDTSLDWAWPTNGRVVKEFSEAKSSKGIDISGNRGQPVLAAASGKVVYSGSGLRGYGKLVIIKHNAIYLSAYAHNQQILVKEGQMINRGQKIAEMGDSDADLVGLHFEVRQMGKPVDPLKYLPEITK